MIQCIYRDVYALSSIKLGLGLLHRMRMYMSRLSDRMTNLDVSYPWMVHDLLDGDTRRWIRLEHLANQAPTSTRAQVVDSDGINRVLLFLLDRNGTGCGVRGIERVCHLGNTPGHFLEV